MCSSPTWVATPLRQIAMFLYMCAVHVSTTTAWYCWKKGGHERDMLEPRKESQHFMTRVYGILERFILGTLSLIMLFI